MIWNETIECMSRDEMRKLQGIRLRQTVERVYHNTIYIVRDYSQFLHFLTIKRSIMINSFYGLPQPDSL